MKSFNTKNTSPFFKGGKKPDRKKNSAQSTKKNSRQGNPVPPLIIDHRPKQ